MKNITRIPLCQWHPLLLFNSFIPGLVMLPDAIVRQIKMEEGKMRLKDGPGPERKEKFQLIVFG
jgi:hypothetical protein